jgi:flagellar motor switch protein FliG
MEYGYKDRTIYKRLNLFMHEMYNLIIQREGAFDMKTFEQIINMTDEDIRQWLKKVEKAGPSRLAIALIDCDSAVTAPILRNMSDRAKAVLTVNIDTFSRSLFKRLLINFTRRRLQKLF